MVSVCSATFNQMRPVIFCLMLTTALFFTIINIVSNSARAEKKNNFISLVF